MESLSLYIYIYIERERESPPIYIYIMSSYLMHSTEMGAEAKVGGEGGELAH